ncbi:MAG: hypothetical protein KGN02_07710 [bacterium]|nr:hypothetical protein [bacterium]
MAKTFHAGVNVLTTIVLAAYSFVRRRPAPVRTSDCKQAMRPADEETLERLHALQREHAERGSMLYALEQQYSVEHFKLYECMRDLKTERMRNAGAYGMLELTMQSARQLQVRIGTLKERLRAYETVEDEYFDTQPIRRDLSEDEA